MLRTKMTLGVVVAALALAVTACGGSGDPTTASTPSGGSKTTAAADTIVVGSANFQENVILANIYAEALKAKGVKVTHEAEHRQPRGLHPGSARTGRST